MASVPSTLPEGEDAPADGALPPASLAELDRSGAAGSGSATPFGIYLHVPFCTTRCGYCDFNTYTAAELGPGASRTDYLTSALAELALARRVLGDRDLPATTIFVGGGTPTLLPPGTLGAFVQAVRDTFGLAPGAEVTTEANPETVDERSLAGLREAGFTRVSFGMQSAVPHVLAVLDRVHSPGRPEACVRWARAAGFEHVSLDLIHGTPGESDGDWAASVDAAIGAGPDHVSAYALIVEPGAPEDDVQADRYLAADAALTAAGFSWYEVSNWAATDAARCRHNLGYWQGGDWWGVGPGAHSHVRGTRWWNFKHPAAYARRLADGVSPAHGRERLDAGTRRVERVLLETRIATGLPVDVLDEPGRSALEGLLADGLVDRDRLAGGQVVLTLRGRLLADLVVRALVP